MKTTDPAYAATANDIARRIYNDVCPAHLTGSVKQVRWADEIRRSALLFWGAMTIEDDTIVTVEQVETLAKVEDAKWWIEVARFHYSSPRDVQLALDTL